MELLNDEYRRHVEEYKRMLRTLIEATQEIKKACGCTEEYEQSLTREVKKTEEDIVTLHREITKLDLRITETEQEIAVNEREREDIIAEYKKSVNESEILGPEHVESELIKLKRRLEGSNRELLKFEDKFQRVQEECVAVKARMAMRVREVDEVGGCLRKKEYY
jgi:chromosome segregation ATPase